MPILRVTYKSPVFSDTEEFTELTERFTAGAELFTEEVNKPVTTVKSHLTTRCQINVIKNVSLFFPSCAAFNEIKDQTHLKLR